MSIRSLVSAALPGAAIALLALCGCAILDPPSRAGVRPALDALRITEINYHPADSGAIDGDEYEFIEIKNAGSGTVDLTDVAFSDGIDYTFPPGAKIAAGEFIVLAANDTSFRQRYGFAPFAVYAGGLNNGGERIALADLRASLDFLSVTYSDRGAWPDEADGEGRSLVPVTAEASGDPQSPAYWRASLRTGGSPGRDDSGVVSATVPCAEPDRQSAAPYRPAAARRWNVVTASVPSMGSGGVAISRSSG